MRIPEINTVCFVGAGTMGCFNALMAATAGYRAVIYDISAEALAATAETLPAMATFMAGQGLLAAEQIPAVLARITTEAELARAVDGAQLVSESVAERLDVKRAVHAELDRLCAAETILTTNTSGLLPSEIATAVGRSDRFAALHSHLAAVLFDIVPCPGTSSQTVDLLSRYVTSLGGSALVLSRENPGYVINAILGPLLTLSLVMVIEGIDSQENIDRAWLKYQHSAIGPFGLMDLFGLNVVYDSWQKPRNEPDALKQKITEFLAGYVDAGQLGVKSAGGFYSYPEPAYAQPGFVGEGAELVGTYEALASVMIANAVLIAANQVAEPEAIDRAWMISFKLPQGPFGSLDKLGIDRFLTVFPALVAGGVMSPQALATITDYLQPLVDGGQLGVASGQGFYHYPAPAYQADNFLTAPAA